MSHPVVFFEVLASDQARLSAFYAAVFGWQYRPGLPYGPEQARFDYVAPPFDGVQVRGGIGRLAAGETSRVNFYVQVDDLEATLERVQAQGGRTTMDPVGPIDGYHFAMFADPEGNTIGIVRPFPPCP